MRGIPYGVILWEGIGLIAVWGHTMVSAYDSDLTYILPYPCNF